MGIVETPDFITRATAPIVENDEKYRQLYSELLGHWGYEHHTALGVGDTLLKDAQEQGYTPDSSVSGDEVRNNLGFRPAPFMLYENLLNLGVYPISSVVKVDDTVSGIGEGINAGCWTVGVARYSNYTNIDNMEQWESMSESEREARVEVSRDKLSAGGAHYVIDSIADLPSVVVDINHRLAKGDKP